MCTAWRWWDKRLLCNAAECQLKRTSRTTPTSLPSSQLERARLTTACAWPVRFSVSFSMPCSSSSPRLRSSARSSSQCCRFSKSSCSCFRLIMVRSARTFQCRKHAWTSFPCAPSSHLSTEEWTLSRRRLVELDAAASFRQALRTFCNMPSTSPSSHFRRARSTNCWAVASLCFCDSSQMRSSSCHCSSSPLSSASHFCRSWA
mmetsp:Transcript_35729/g.106769  ORF Transcript_35729/g.106769 Transcript_35729/m.106769 type:complete len:203 (+) Transcript_35729:1491-2099(+)